MEIERHPTHRQELFFRTFKALNIAALGLRVEKPADFAPALAKAVEANRPVVIDVVTDIDALAPLAVS